MKSKFLLFLVGTASAGAISAQEAVVPSGTTTVGAGSVSWTLGQVAPAFGTSSSGEATWGVQHARERIALGAVELPGPWSSLRIFPNPAAQWVRLEGWADWSEAVQLRALDATGRLVWEHRSTEPFVQLEVSDWSAGMYLFELTVPGSPAARFELIKTNP
jgi:hypothetical protein